MTPFTRPPAPPHAPCCLRHHNIGMRVCWRQGFQFRSGQVVEHVADSRFIRIQLADGSVQSMPCGGVAAL